MRRAALVPAVLALGAAAVLAGCGSKGATVTRVQTVGAPRTGTATTATIPTIAGAHPPTTTTTTTTTTPPASSGGTLADAEAKVRAEGYTPDDPGDYDSSHTLRVLIGTRSDSGDGYAKRAFFFVGGRYIGTDTSDDSANIRVESQSDATVTLAYAIYGPNDALCCPGGTRTVRYEWNGSRLVPLDPIPSRSSRG